MSLHSLLSVTIGVPNVPETAAYYTDFGLTPGEDGWFSTADAGRQLRLLPSPVRRLLELRVGADDADDLARAGDKARALQMISKMSLRVYFSNPDEETRQRMVVVLSQVTPSRDALSFLEALAYADPVGQGREIIDRLTVLASAAGPLVLAAVLMAAAAMAGSR